MVYDDKFPLIREVQLTKLRGLGGMEYRLKSKKFSDQGFGPACHQCRHSPPDDDGEDAEVEDAAPTSLPETLCPPLILLTDLLAAVTADRDCPTTLLLFPDQR